ncbi:MAG: radical SAM protein [Victivallales bacterium]|nr:radical SAM protein [Victivallales bacterium]
MFDLDAYRHCELCPRRCGVDRTAGQRGFCGEGAELHIASIGAHFGEEPPLVGRDGSGTVFLTGCSCGCFFCQNYQLSSEHLGEFLNIDETVRRIQALTAQGIRNVNLVTPDHFWPHLQEVIRQLRDTGCDLPVIWNSSGYSRVEMLAQQAEIIDIFLPDFKYASAELAKRCMGREDYPAVARDGLRFLVDQKGFLRPFDETGELAATRGVLVRHLVLPGEVENSLAVLDQLYEDHGPLLPISVMRQFRPMPECLRRNQFTRLVMDEEYSRVIDHVRKLGFTRVFIQPDCGDENFVPDFRHAGEPFKGNAQRKVKGER